MGPDTSFHRLLWDDAQLLPDEKIKLVPDDKIRRVVLCSGKVYYDLYEEREKRGIDDIYLLRVEQLYPFPTKALVHGARRASSRPRSSGARRSRATWARGSSSSTYLEWVLNQIGAKHRRPRYAGAPGLGRDRGRPDVEAPGAAEAVARRGAGIAIVVIRGGDPCLERLRRPRGRYARPRMTAMRTEDDHG